MAKPKTMMIDEVKYIREDAIKKEDLRPIVFDGDNLASCCIGEKVIVRTYNAGLNAGIVEAADETGIILKDARRIWYHKPKDKSLCWYEGVAVSGLSSDSKVSCTIPRKVIIEHYEVTICSDSAFESIMGMVPNEQN